MPSFSPVKIREIVKKLREIVWGKKRSIVSFWIKVELYVLENNLKVLARKVFAFA